MVNIFTIKILICGSSAGCSKFIDAINELNFSVDPEPIKTMLGGVRAEDNDDKSLLYIFALVDYLSPLKIPSDMWEVFNDQALGVIILVDSHKDVFQDRITEIQSLLRFIIKDHRKTTVIGVEFQSDSNALSYEHIQAVLDIPPEIPVVPCVATDKESVKRVLVALLDEVLKAMARNKEV